MQRPAEPTRPFSNPLPGLALGDPFVLRWRGRFYLFGTNDGGPLPEGRTIPVFRSDDLIHWEALGGALEPAAPGVDHWAPEVLAWNGRFWMVVSFGDVERVGHALWVAVAESPEGPYRLERRISDPSDVFSIDGAWLLDDDGRLYLYRCLDFVQEDAPPHGTGIVVQPMADPLTPLGPPVTVLRAHAPWQVFETDRVMPLYGGRRFAEWTTIEGPAPVRRAGRVFCGYSGGNFLHAYGTGEAVADAPLGPYTDLRGREGPIFATTPGLVEGPGHFSVVQPDGLHDWIVLHGRRPGSTSRQVWLCPASWGPEGVTIGELTDRPQPAPPRPAVLWRAGEPLDGLGLGHGTGDRAGSGSPSAGADGLRITAGADHFWYGRVDSAETWAAEVYLRWPDAGNAVAGLAVGPAAADAMPVCFVVRPHQARCELRTGQATIASQELPVLGAIPFNPGSFHRVAVRIRKGRAEFRVDGVRVLGDRELRAERVGLTASGPGSDRVVFDALMLARESSAELS